MVSVGSNYLLLNCDILQLKYVIHTHIHNIIRAKLGKVVPGREFLNLFRAGREGQGKEIVRRKN